MKATLKCALLLTSALMAAPALAQQPTAPPEHYTLNHQGVDLVRGTFVVTEKDVEIGDPGRGGLAFIRQSGVDYWRDLNAGHVGVPNSGSLYEVVADGVTVRFTLSGTVFTSPSISGYSLTKSGSSYMLEAPNGTRYYFDDHTPASPFPAWRVVNLVRRVHPGGDEAIYSWQVVNYCVAMSGPSCFLDFPVRRLASISNNSGYELRYVYESDVTPVYLDRRWGVLKSVIGINLAVERCTPVEGGCAGLTRNWPRADYTYSSEPGFVGQFQPASVTDQSGRTRTYTYGTDSQGYTVDGVIGIRLPGETSNQVSVTYAANKVSSVTDASGTWNYSYADSGATRTTTVTGPLGQSLSVVSNLSIGRATSVTNALSQTTSYTYDTQNRLKRVTQPEGDYGELTYDSRGNVTQMLQVAKAGSGLSNITYSAAYPATCTNPVTCNKPTSTTNARGGVTDYTYDTVHGGPLTITAPAPTAGADRPQARFSYAPQTAYFKNAAGSIVAASTSVTLPTAVSTCAAGTSPGCVGTANESRAVWTYGSPGVANNLAPTILTQRDGTGALSAATTFTYTANGDVASVDGPLAGAADTTTYRYDDARQRVGVISADPDDGGPLARRAQRITYNARGLPTLVETGTVAGLTDTNWSAFSSLQQTANAYDSYGRSTNRRLQAGGVTYRLAQTTYDTAGREDCVATRMNSATFASPPTSACTLATAGAFGPDRVAKYGYDALGRATSTISGFGSGSPITESLTFTANGQVQTVTDGAGNVSTMVYDGFDRLSRLRYPNASGGGSSTTDYEEYGYDAGGNVVSRRNRGGEIFALTFDALGRNTFIDAPSGSDDTTLTYDLLDRPLTVSAGGRTLTNGWDALGRQTSAASALGTVGYGYDLAGRRTSVQWPDAFWVAYDYNNVGDLTAMRENGVTTWNLASWAYDGLGRRTTQYRANGATTSWGYDGAGRVASLSHDMAGTANDLTLSFTYSPADQIATRTSSNTAYAYTPGVGTTSYVNNGRNQVTSVGGSTVSYDGRQNISASPFGSYTYNGRNELTSATVSGATTRGRYRDRGLLDHQSGGLGRYPGRWRRQYDLH